MTLSTILGSLGIKGFTNTGGAGYDKRLVVTDAGGKIAVSLLPAEYATDPLTATYFVDADIGDDVDGNGSIVRPFQTIGAAVDANAAAPTAMVIILSPGTYDPPEITDAGQTVLVLVGADPSLVTITDYVTFNNNNNATNTLILVGVTAATVRDITTTSTFNVWLHNSNVTTASYNADPAAVNGTVTVDSSSSLTNVPATNLDVSYSGGAYKAGIVPTGTRDGANRVFTLPDGLAYRAGSITVLLNGVAYDNTEFVETSDVVVTLAVDTILPDSEDIFTVSFQLSGVKG